MLATNPALASAKGTPDLSTARPKLDHKPSKLTLLAFFGLLIAGGIYMFYNLNHDITTASGAPTTLMPYVLLGVALITALGFEFVNGFHDTANAVATVIYTNSLPAPVAVIWSGFFNFLGVLLSSGLVAFGIIALLPVELILQVGSGAGFAMIFALLIAAILWNLGTWYFGLPASSSHTLVGSIVGVGIANALLHGRSATVGVDWAQVEKIGMSLLISPLVGFGLTASVALQDLNNNQGVLGVPIEKSRFYGTATNVEDYAKQLEKNGFKYLDLGISYENGEIKFDPNIYQSGTYSAVHKADFVGRPPFILGGNPATGGNCWLCYSHSSYFAEIPNKYLVDSNGNIIRDNTGQPIKNSLYDDYVKKWGEPTNNDSTNHSLPKIVNTKENEEVKYENFPF